MYYIIDSKILIMRSVVGLGAVGWMSQREKYTHSHSKHREQTNDCIYLISCFINWPISSATCHDNK